jgi:hypothetical protein
MINKNLNKYVSQKDDNVFVIFSYVEEQEIGLYLCFNKKEGYSFLLLFFKLKIELLS